MKKKLLPLLPFTIYLLPALLKVRVQIILKLGAVPIGTVLTSRSTTLQKCEEVPRRARI